MILTDPMLSKPRQELFIWPANAPLSIDPPSHPHSKILHINNTRVPLSCFYSIIASIVTRFTLICWHIQYQCNGKQFTRLTQLTQQISYAKTSLLQMERQVKMQSTLYFVFILFQLGHYDQFEKLVVGRSQMLFLGELQRCQRI